MNKTLFELNDEMQQLLEAIEFLDGDDAGITAVVQGYFNRLQGDISTKLDGVASLISEFDARCSIRKQQADRLAQRAKVDWNKANRLKQTLLWWFQVNGKKTVETDNYRITLAQNGGKSPVVLTVPVEELPSEYLLETITIRPDMDAIRQALENGAEIPGVQIGERGSNIRIL